MKWVRVMAYEGMPRPALDYAPCRYGESRVLYRGPKQRLYGSFIAVLGGSETYGRFLADPYPSLLQDETGVRTINFGCVNAGVDVFLQDEAVLSAARNAQAVVIQITGAQNLSNRFYAVHPRRNDRFVRASAMLRAVFPEVDFTEFHFTGHMLTTLQHTSDARFALIRDELQRVWVARMNLLMAQIGRPVILLWLGDRTPDDLADRVEDGGPMFVTRRMIRMLRGRIAETIEHRLATDSGVGSLHGKVFTDAEEAAALAMPGPGTHHALAVRLAEILRPSESQGEGAMSGNHRP
ncbi:DUF6473 family protein [Oceaniovalibus sp. ACAM 378]|uniref:DUF6473 family protein n=1 Tax=Oceaniovalibus sp. ACAM 378 TaxID=2599923 RepID=UPI00351B7B3F